MASLRERIRRNFTRRNSRSEFLLRPRERREQTINKPEDMYSCLAYLFRHRGCITFAFDRNRAVFLSSRETSRSRVIFQHADRTDGRGDRELKENVALASSHHRTDHRELTRSCRVQTFILAHRDECRVVTSDDAQRGSASPRSRRTRRLP